MRFVRQCVSRQVSILCRAGQKKENGKGQQVNKVIYYTKDMKNTQTPEAEVLDQLKMTNMCCRRMMLTHVDVE